MNNPLNVPPARWVRSFVSISDADGEPADSQFQAAVDDARCDGYTLESWQLSTSTGKDLVSGKDRERMTIVAVFVKA